MLNFIASLYFKMKYCSFINYISICNKSENEKGTCFWMLVLWDTFGEEIVITMI